MVIPVTIALTNATMTGTFLQGKYTVESRALKFAGPAISAALTSEVK